MLLWSFILPNRSGIREDLPFYLYDFLCTYRFSKFEGWFNWYSYWIHYFVCSIPNEADPSSEVGKYVLIKRSNQFYIYSFFFNLWMEIFCVEALCLTKMGEASCIYGLPLWTDSPQYYTTLGQAIPIAWS